MGARDAATQTTSTADAETQTPRHTDPLALLPTRSQFSVGGLLSDPSFPNFPPFGPQTSIGHGNAMLAPLLPQNVLACNREAPEGWDGRISKDFQQTGESHTGALSHVLNDVADWRTPSLDEMSMARYVEARRALPAQAALDATRVSLDGKQGLTDTTSHVGASSLVFSPGPREPPGGNSCKNGGRRRKWTAMDKAKHSDACRKKDRLTLADKLRVINLHASGKNQVMHMILPLLSVQRSLMM